MSGCVRLCLVVSGCVRLCPIVSSCHSKGWCGGAAGRVPAAQPPQPGVAAAKPLVLCKIKLALHYKHLKKNLKNSGRRSRAQPPPPRIAAAKPLVSFKKPLALH